MSGLLAVGAHIGDADLMAGPLLAEARLRGHETAILALTPGERGHPRLPPAEYKVQKMGEGRVFAAAVGARFLVYDDLSDGYLAADEPTAERVADTIRELRPDVVLAHWRHSIHSDHEHASRLTERGRFLAGLPVDGKPRHRVGRLLYAENWEDADGFETAGYVPISDEAFQLWRTAIGGQAFARGETYGFRYIDYYTALMTVRGCLAGATRAVALGQPGQAGPLDIL